MRDGLNYEGQTFEVWEREVDRELIRLSGMDSSFLPDWNSYDAFKEDQSPKDAASDWLEHAQTF